MTEMQKKIEAIREQMRLAGDRGQVTLLAAVKYATAEQINELHRDCGISDIGENRVQQLLEHYDHLEDREHLRIHFIGSLQTNKVKYIIDKVCMSQSLDSVHLAEEIERQCEKAGRTMDVLVEVNSGEETNKGGVLPGEVESFCRSLAAFPALRLRGFMTMAPKFDDPAQYHKYFSQTYRQCLDIWQKKLDNIGINIRTSDAPIFSMGMSGSYQVAIAEGSTMVRIGGAIFRS